MEAAEDAGICFGYDKRVRETTSDDEMKEIVKDLMKKRNTNGNKGLPNNHVNHVNVLSAVLAIQEPQQIPRSYELMYEIILK